jgi:hypothetical protein
MSWKYENFEVTQENELSNNLNAKFPLSINFKWKYLSLNLTGKFQLLIYKSLIIMGGNYCVLVIYEKLISSQS